MQWIKVNAGSPYFCLEDGKSWAPVGHNEAMPWPDLAGLYKRKDPTAVYNYLQMQQQHGITCLRIMMEYCQNNRFYLENPAGVFNPAVVEFFDDLFTLCEKFDIRLLITPFDTYWMWKRWRFHPYNKLNGGPVKSRTTWLCNSGMVELTLRRVGFIINRWGGSGALFAWDLWNEIHPKYSSTGCHGLLQYMDVVSTFIRQNEVQRYGKSHLQTVSVYGSNYEVDDAMAAIVFRHRNLDFATTHLYAKGSIDSPKNTVAPAITAGRMISKVLEEIPPERPFLDSEHGPIYRYVNKKRMLKEDFDNEYFKHIQWVHVASGGAGGGMRWPYRRPHQLTAGMQAHQRVLSRFIKRFDWTNFQRMNINFSVACPAHVSAFYTASHSKAVIYLLRNRFFDTDGKLSVKVKPFTLYIKVQGLQEAIYRFTLFDTSNENTVRKEVDIQIEGAELSIDNFVSDRVIILQRIDIAAK